MVYKTKTYIAADWDSDEDAVKKLHQWNDSKHWSLNFRDAHELTQARDNSLYCSVKSSLKTRLDASKVFILIVGDKTDDVTKGGCQRCGSYNSHKHSCAKGHPVDYRSYIKYECDKAVEAEMKIVILYKAASVDRSKCPVAVRDVGIHTPMYKYSDGSYCWDYDAVKKALKV